MGGKRHMEGERHMGGERAHTSPLLPHHCPSPHSCIENNLPIDIDLSPLRPHIISISHNTHKTLHTPTPPICAPTFMHSLVTSHILPLHNYNSSLLCTQLEIKES